MAEFKVQFGLTEDGHLGWTRDLAENFVAETRRNIPPEESSGNEVKQRTEITPAVNHPEDSAKRKLPGWMTGEGTDKKKKKIF